MIHFLYNCGMDESTRDAWLLLTLVSGLSPKVTNRLVSALGQPHAVLQAGVDELAEAGELTSRRATTIRRKMDEVLAGDALEQERELMEEHDVELLTIADSGYPRLLKLIEDSPPVLYLRGQLLAEDAIALAVVGSRKCTHYGREQAARFGGLLASGGVTVVSGGAFGVDAAAHRGALQAGGRTLAVVGSGLANPYPDKHADLFEQIVTKGQGAVMSELPMSAPPRPANFPARNRIISGLSLGVLVIEAALRSGALITARLAAEEHGREVLAVPGRVDQPQSAGCHKMIREGWAGLVTNMQDVVQALGEAGQSLQADGPVIGKVENGTGGRERANQPSLFDQGLSESQKQLIAALGQARSVDELAMETGLIVPVIQADLTMLQVRGLVSSESGRYRRRG